jgi:tetratricopeptide (TPR) repeat protein
VALAVYLYTLSPGVVGGDSLELGLAARTLGVPHYPGYPLYCLVARVADAAVGDPALATNLLSALTAALAAAALALLGAGAAPFAASGGAAGPAASARSGVPAAIAALVALAWAFATPVWRYAVVAEVYLPAALLDVSFWVTLLHGRRSSDPRHALLGGYLAILGALHQPLLATNVLVWGALAGPALLRRRMLASIPLLAAPLLLLLYAPVRSAAGVAPDYLQKGGILDGVRWFAGSGEFTRYGLRSPGELSSTIGSFVDRMLDAWPVPLWLLSATGLSILGRSARGLGIALGASLFFRLLFASSYRIVDIESYDIAAVTLAAAAAAPGIVWLWRLLTSAPALRRGGAARARTVLALAALALAVSASLVRHREVASKRGFRFLDVAAADLLGPIEGPAVLFTPTEHWTAFASFGSRVRGRGPRDLDIVDLSGRFHRQWLDPPEAGSDWSSVRREFLHALLARARSIGVIGEVRTATETASRDGDLPPDAVIAERLSGKTVYSIMSLPDTTGLGGWITQPVGFAFRFVPAGTKPVSFAQIAARSGVLDPDVEAGWADPRGFALVDPLLEMYGQLFRVAASEAFEADDLAAGDRFLAQSLRFDPDSWQTLWLRARIAIAVGDRETSLASARRALELEPDAASVASFIAEGFVADGDRERGVRFLEEYLRKHPRAAEAWVTLARVLEPDAAGRPRALAAYGRAIELLPPGDPQREALAIRAREIEARLRP